jgi:hypothetical protein
MSEAAEPFFRRDGDRLVPTQQAKGPWKANSLHGRVIAGLLAAEIERSHGDPAFLPVRLTVDMYRAPTMEPLHVETRVVRGGQRIKVIDADLMSEGRSAGRATCQFLRRGEAPESRAWCGDSWDAPGPEAFMTAEAGPESMFGAWELRWISGQLGEIGQRRVWMRETRAMIGGEVLTPFLRVAAGVDYVSPLANVGEMGSYSYINSDLTLYLHRLPVGAWIGYESLAHEASDGIALGHCNIYDAQGRIGWGSACALALGAKPLV